MDVQIENVGRITKVKMSSNKSCFMIIHETSQAWIETKERYVTNLTDTTSPMESMWASKSVCWDSSSISNVQLTLCL